MNYKETTTARLEQAALWWQRLHEESVRPEEISEWHDWRQRDPGNLRAFEKIEDLGARFDALDVETRDGLLREILDEPPTISAPVVAIGAYTYLGRGNKANQTVS